MNMERKPVDGAGITVMTILCIVLGLHQVAIKMAAPDIAPILQIGVRSGLSSLLLFILIAWRGEGFSLSDGTLRPGMVLGALFSLEFLFVAEGLRYTTASHMSVFLYTSPVFTALMLHRFMPAERLVPAQWLGIGLAFCGIVAAFAGGMFRTGINERILLGDGLAILGAILWAASTVYIRCTTLAAAPATKTLLYQLICAFILLLGYAALTGRGSGYVVTTTAVASVIFQAVIITFGSFLVWFSLLRRYNVSQLSVFLFLSPIFGVTFGVLLLHDPLDLNFIVGAVLVMAGITLVSKPRPLPSEA